MERVFLRERIHMIKINLCKFPLTEDTGAGQICGAKAEVAISASLVTLLEIGLNIRNIASTSGV